MASSFDMVPYKSIKEGGTKAIEAIEEKYGPVHMVPQSSQRDPSDHNVCTHLYIIKRELHLSSAASIVIILLKSKTHNKGHSKYFHKTNISLNRG